VAVSHRAIVNFLLWCGDKLMRDAEALTPFITSLSFDASLKQFMTALSHGRPVWLPPLPTPMTVPALLEALASRERTLLNTVPSLWRAIVDLVEEGDADLPESLVGVILGGEALEERLYRRTVALAPDLPVTNVYGPTETTSLAATARMVPGEPVTIGRPIDNARLYVLDRRMFPVPPGVMGELFIGGAGLARGYWHQPAITAERYLPDPFGGEGQRLYRSGDLVRRLRDGRLVYAGRADHQVKIRGYRMELGEIETRLGRLEGVSSAVVVLRTDRTEPYLAAFLVTDRTVAVLKSAAAQQLPDFMVPSVWVVLETLPLTPNGKIDRKALAGLPIETAMTSSEHPGTPPRTPVERKLARFWSGLFGKQTVSREDDFFTLGGNSLMIMRVTAWIRREFGVAIPLASIYGHATLQSVAALIEATGEEMRPPTPLIPLRPTGDRRPLFLVHPVGGSALCYRALVASLPADRPVYGLERLEWTTGGRPEPLSIESMAAAYLEAIRETQPEGPYLLGGWSLGGVIAYEMSRQLEAAGETIAALILLDSFAPTEARRQRTSAQVAQSAGDDEIPRWAMDAALREVLVNGGEGSEQDETTRVFAAMIRVNMEASAVYAPSERHAPGRMLLIRATQRPETAPLHEEDRNCNGWDRFAETVDVVPIETHHYGLVSPDWAATVATTLEAHAERHDGPAARTTDNNPIDQR